METVDLAKVVNAPKMIFIGRKALAKSPERVQEALRLISVAGTFAMSDLDAHLATVILPNVMGVHQPFAIVADFDFDIAAILEGGRVVPGELPEVPANPEEEQKLKSGDYQDQMADAILAGIRRYFAQNPPLARARVARNP